MTDLIAPAVVSQHFVEAAVALGYDNKSEPNAMQQEGAGLYQLTIKAARASERVYYCIFIAERSRSSQKSAGDQGHLADHNAAPVMSLKKI